MNVLIVNAADTKGGAAQVGYRLARSLHERGHGVCYLVGKQFASDRFIERINYAPSNPKALPQRAIHRLGINQLALDSRFPFQLGRDFLRQFDVVHLHDLPTFNLLGFPWLTRLRPTVWTLHTLAPFTGNCLYPYDCERWKHRCGRCPQFGQFPLIGLRRDASGFNLWAKRWVYRVIPI